jgi:hypothetical protein
LPRPTPSVEVELNSVSDNPLVLVEEERVVHGGNFHGQPVAMALDQLKAALVTLGVASERRIARTVDARLSGGLPPFLIRGDAGLHSGFMGLQYCATSLAAEQALLAAPASVRSIPTNANNQDMVPMGMLAAATRPRPRRRPPAGGDRAALRAPGARAARRRPGRRRHARRLRRHPPRRRAARRRPRPARRRRSGGGPLERVPGRSSSRQRGDQPRSHRGTEDAGALCPLGAMVSRDHPAMLRITVCRMPPLR